MEGEAGVGVGVIGDLGALVGGEGYGRVGVAGGDDSEAAGGEGSTKAGGEGEGDVFFKHVVGEMGSGIGAPVRGVKEDDGASGWLLGRGDAGGQENGSEAYREVFEGKGQGRLVDCKG